MQHIILQEIVALYYHLGIAAQYDMMILRELQELRDISGALYYFLALYRCGAIIYDIAGIARNICDLLLSSWHCAAAAQYSGLTLPNISVNII